MARYDANRGYNNHGVSEPGYGGPSRAILNYAATSESHVRTEQVVEYGTFSVSHHYPKPFDQLYKSIHGVGDNQVFEPWGPIHHGGSKKGQKSPPKFSHTQGSPHKKILHRDNSPPSRGQYHYKNFNSDESDDDYDDDVERDYERVKPKPNRYANETSYNPHGTYNDDVICENGVCYPKPKHTREKDYEREKPKPNSYAHETSCYPNGTPSYAMAKPNSYAHETSYYPDSTPNYNCYAHETSYYPNTTPSYAMAKPNSYAHETSYYPNGTHTYGMAKPNRYAHETSYYPNGAAKHHFVARKVGAIAEYNETVDCREATKKYNGVLMKY